MKQPENLHINVQPTADLTAIDRWLTARGEYQKQASDESEYDYIATCFALGAAFADRYPEDEESVEAKRAG